jgi:hypothetical protein
MLLKKNLSWGTGMCRTATIGHHRLRSHTLDHVEGDAQDRNLGAHTGIMEDIWIKTPIIPKGLSGIEDTGATLMLPPQQSPPTDSSVHPPLAGNSEVSSLITARPEATTRDPSSDPPQLTTIDLNLTQVAILGKGPTATQSQEEPQELTPMAILTIIREEQRIQMDHILSSLDRIDTQAIGYDEQLTSLSMRIDTVEEGYDKLIKKITDLIGEFTAFHQNIVLDKTIQQAAPIPSTDRDQQSSIDNLYYPPRDKLNTPTRLVVKPRVAEPPQTVQPPTTDSQLSNDKIVCWIVHPTSHDLRHETQEFGTYPHQSHWSANIPDKSISRAQQHREEHPHWQMAPQCIEIIHYCPNPWTAHPLDDSSRSNESDGSHCHWGRNRTGCWDDSSQCSRTPWNIQEPYYPSTQIGGMAKANSTENY